MLLLSDVHSWACPSIGCVTHGARPYGLTTPQNVYFNSVSKLSWQHHPNLATPIMFRYLYGETLLQDASLICVR